MGDPDHFAVTSGDHRGSHEVSERVRSLIMAAEKVADAVTREARRRSEGRLHDAEVEASQRLEAARREADALVTEQRLRISQLTDAIVERAERVLGDLDEAKAARARLETLIRSLDEASSQLEHEGGNGRLDHRTGAVHRLPGPVDRPPAPRRSPDLRSPGVTSEPFPKDAERSYGARREPPGLVAKAMAGAGSSRGDVAAHLQRTFDLNDPHKILDEVFGKG